MVIQEKLNQALLSKQPLIQLREAVRDLLDQGCAREALLSEMENFRSFLRETKREDDEDIVLEVMDFIVGWSSPHMTL
jgi:hypothetical protein